MKRGRIGLVSGLVWTLTATAPAWSAPTPLTRKVIAQRFGDQGGKKLLDEMIGRARSNQWRPTPGWLATQGRKYGRLLVVSDLHPGTGTHPVTGKISPSEDFMPDRQELDFHNMLRSEWSASKTDGKKRTLVLNGDILEFMQTTTAAVGEKFASDQYGPLNTPRETVKKLRSIREGHPGLFRAYAEHLASGHRIVLMPGNHDRQLHNVAVRAAMRGIIQSDLTALFEADTSFEAALTGGARRVAAVKKARSVIRDQYEFHPIFVHGDFFAHHGHQNDPTNAFSTLLGDLYKGPSRDKPMEAAFGDYFVKAVFNTVETQIPWGDNGGSKLTIAYKSLVKDGNGRLMSVGKLLKAIGWVMTREGRGSDADHAALKKSEHADITRFVRDYKMTDKFNELRQGDKALSEHEVVDLFLEYQSKHPQPLLNVFKKNAGLMSRAFTALRKLPEIRKAMKASTMYGHEEAANQVLFSKMGIKTYATGHDHEFRLQRYFHGSDGREKLAQVIDSATWTDSLPSKTARNLMAEPVERRGVIAVDFSEAGSHSTLMRWDPARAKLVQAAVMEDVAEATQKK